MPRFIHAADIHLDSPMAGVAARGDAQASTLASATRAAFRRLIDDAVAEAVDFVVIAGDLYDGDWRDYSTGLVFVEGARRLAAADIPLFLIHGNHDAQSLITRALTLPANVTVFPADRPATHVLEDLGIALHGQSFAERAVTHNLAVGYPDPVPGIFNIGLLHTALNGREGHDTYAPASVEDLVARGYDYWALGHVHTREVVREQPIILFPGNLQGRSIRETGPRGYMRVTVEGRRVAASEFVACDVARWAVAEVDAAGAEAIEEVARRMAEAMAAAHAVAERRTLAVRVEVRGETRLDQPLRADPDLLQAEAESAAAAISPDLWVEGVRIRTCQPSAGGRQSPDALAELLRSLDELAREPQTLSALAAELGAVIAKLPRDLREEIAGEIGSDGLLADARALVAERLRG